MILILNVHNGPQPIAAMVFPLRTAGKGDFPTAASKYRTDLAPSWVRKGTFSSTVFLLLQLVF